MLGRFDAGAEHAAQALALAEALGGDDTAGASPINLLARIHCLRGEAREAIAYAARNVEQMRRLGNRIEEAAISGVLAFAYGLHGEFAQAFEAAEHGIELARKVEHLPTLAACLHFRGVAKGWHGEIDGERRQLRGGAGLRRESGRRVPQVSDLRLARRGSVCSPDRSEAAEADLTRCLALADQIGTTFHRGAFQAFLARIRLLQGDLDGALQTSDRGAQDRDRHRPALEPLDRAADLRRDPAGSDAADAANAEHAVRAAIDIQEKRECRCDLAASQLVLSRSWPPRAIRRRARRGRAGARPVRGDGHGPGPRQGACALARRLTPEADAPTVIVASWALCQLHRQRDQATRI